MVEAVHCAAEAALDVVETAISPFSKTAFEIRLMERGDETERCSFFPQS
jgi:hypothetical protein